MSPEPFRNQKYKVLKKQLIKEGKLFTDVEFPPTDTSLYAQLGHKSFGDNVEWKRPGDIVKDPHLVVEGINFDDVRQGILGNCWFVSACSALTRHKTLWNKVISDVSEQEWDSHKPERYCGIFHFCFWRFGRWVDVVVDDLLPTRNNELVFARSRTTNEFWSALLEKAFAKLNGCYEALTGGTLIEAFMDITGGVPETISVGTVPAYRDDPLARSDLFNYLKDAHDMKALMAAAIVAKPEEMEQQLECGLVKGHSYAISAVKRIALDAHYKTLLSSLFSNPDKIMMVRLQNPWGEKEWNGPWSDGASEWQQISKQQQSDLGLKIEEDGQFWMTWDDFLHYFTDISVCHQINTSFFKLGKRYNETVFQGMWQSGPSRGHYTDRAGGCLNFKETCLCNPQYRFDIDEDGREIFISLMQRDIRERRRQGAAYLTIGMMVQRVEDNRVFRLHQLLELQATSDYVNTRSVFLRMKNLKRGRYLLIPTTYAPAEEGEFMIRFYTTFHPNAEELTKDKPSGGFFSCSCCRKRYNCVTRLRITGADCLRGPPGGGSSGVNPYCIVKCEGQTYRSNVCKDVTSPRWDLLLIFVRRHVDRPVLIDIWSSNLLKDTFLGRALLDCPVTNDIVHKEVGLLETKKTGDHYEPMPGKLLVEIATFDNPIYL